MDINKTESMSKKKMDGTDGCISMKEVSATLQKASYIRPKIIQWVKIERRLIVYLKVVYFIVLYEHLVDTKCSHSHSFL